MVKESDSVRETMAAINRGARGIALVVDASGKLLDTVTDGDVRRAILDGVAIDAPVSLVLCDKQKHNPNPPVMAHVGADRAALRQMMAERTIRQIPLIDDDGQLVDLITLDELAKPELPVKAVIMAGGFGSRLMPLTEDTPKPMLPVGEKPLMEHIVNRLRTAGIREVNVTTHYQAEKIVEHFQDGRKFGVELSYVNETQPLGTAGSLSLMSPPDEPLLVLNGDILTDVDYRAVVEFHREQRADLTVCVRQYDLQVPYGVVESTGTLVDRIVEKPVMTFFVNAGIYLLEPSVHAYIPSGTRYDMTELVAKLIADGKRVANFPIVEYWLDIGRQDDYLVAQEAVRSGEVGK